MSNSSRSIILLMALLLGLLIATSTMIAYASEPITFHPDSPLQTRIAGTGAANKAHVEGTADAIRTRVAATANAVRTTIPGTVGSVRADISSTLTAIAPTVNGYKAMYQETATALRATASAIPANLAATATAFASKVAVISSTLQRTILPGDEAASAIASYGQAILGVSVNVVSAHGVNENVVGTFKLPDIITNWQTLSADLSVQSYTAVLSNGAAWLAYGAGTSAVNNGPAFNVQTESLGVYTLSVPGSVTDAQSAEALAKATFPALANKPYTHVASTLGYTFYAADSVTAPDPKTGKLTLEPEAIVLYVLPGKNGQVAVSAAVGSGQYSALVQP